MKTSERGVRPVNTGFTLVELLIVMAIIALLASMVMTVIPVVIKKTKVSHAHTQMAALILAINRYQTDYGHFPLSQTAKLAANQPANGDFTYGGTVQTPAGPASVGTVVGATALPNSEVIAILMNLTTFPGSGGPTVNDKSLYNSKKEVYLTNVSWSGDASSPGLGTDLIYRDPWGNPYFISMDVNDNDLCEDAFYRVSTLSNGGINGLILQPDGHYAFHGKIMIWSAGPDGKVNPNVAAHEGENTDNVLSWH